MTEKLPQHPANHARFDPIYHFFALPVVTLSVIAAIVHLAQRPNWFSAWLVLFALQSWWLHSRPGGTPSEYKTA